MHSPSVIWRPAPFIRILAFFIPGILLQYYFRLSVTVILPLLLIGIVFIIYCRVRPETKTFKYINLPGVIICICNFLLGVLVTYYNEPATHKNWYASKLDSAQTLVVTIVEPAIKKKKSYQYNAKVLSVDEEIAHGKILLYISDAVEQLPKINNRLLIKNKLTTFQSTGTPGAFEYGKYMQMKGVHYTAWLQAQDFQIIGNDQNIFRSWLYDCKDHIIQTLNRFFTDPEVRGIAEALLIGYKENLDDDLKIAYTETGVIHVIAISGLHLGLIYVVLVYILKKVKWVWRKVLLRVLIVLGVLWIFSFLTGAPASVLRSAVMFSCIHIGESFFRKSSVFNTIAASAFVLLCIQPYFLWDPGFTLSYFAVLGIVLLQRPIEKSIYLKPKILRAIWSMASVTIAAQISTLPLCLYYFHQFPNLFLITNLLVVPLSTLILFAEIIMLAFSWLYGIEYFAVLVMWMIQFMNWFIVKMGSIPFAVTYPIFANVFSSWMLGGILAFGSRAVLMKSKKALYLSLAFCLLFSLGFSYNYFTALQHQKVLIYNARQSSADIFHRNHFINIQDSMQMDVFNYHHKPARIHFRIHNEVETIPGVYLHEYGILLGEKKWIHLHQQEKKLHLTDTITADVLWISNNYPVPQEEQLKKLKVQTVVLDGSNSLWKIEQWKTACEQLLLRCHSVAQEGTFLYNW